jgi:hypothetical protein
VAPVPEGLQVLKYRVLESLKSSGTDTLSEARGEFRCLLDAVRVDHATHSTRKFGTNFADMHGRSVGIVRLRTTAKEF